MATPGNRSVVDKDQIKSAVIDALSPPRELVDALLDRVSIP
jgi:hypothetical protein